MDKIVTHEDWQPVALDQFIAGYWYRYRDDPLPLIHEAKGSAVARIVHGRWIVQCPNVGNCNEATVVSKRAPHFICNLCGSPENDGQWYNVAFPADARLIEAELLKRGRRQNRNWEPHETLDDLRRENAAIVKAVCY